LLAWFERMFRALRECPEFGSGPWQVLDTGRDDVLGMCYDGGRGTMVALSNLADTGCSVDLTGSLAAAPTRVLEVFANRRYSTTPGGLDEVELDGSGYRWLRLTLPH
jgi:maltose alpha-D-glucosyltransferase/alpha-amylase